MNLLKKILLTIFISFSVQNLEAQILTISGIVKDAQTLKEVPLASVEVKRFFKKFMNGDYVNSTSDLKSLLADSSGKYQTTLPKGEYILEVSALGFLKKSKYINLTKNTVLDIELSEQVNQLEAVEVAARKAENNVKALEMSTIKVNLQALKTTPIVFGEGDIIRVLTLQPGVTTVGEGAGGFSVRGGRVDQNLVLLDDAPLFNTSHLLGMFTAINAEAVKNATLYKNGIPARYGGRLSSLLQMNTKLGTQENRTVVAIGPISSNVLVERNFSKNKGSIMLAGRGAYPNWVFGFFPRRFNGSKASFYDLNGSIQYRINNNNSLSLTGYQSQDAFKFPEDTSYFWGSTISTLQWGSQLNSRLSMNTKGILSNYTYGVNGLKNYYEFRFDSKIKHREIRNEYIFEINDKNTVEWGGNMIFYKFSPGNQEPENSESLIKPFRIDDEFGRESAVFASYDLDISKRISVQTGIRYSAFQNIGGKVFQYRENQPLSRETLIDTLDFGKKTVNFKYGGFEPRFLLKVELSDLQSIKLSYNRTRQYLHLITNTTAISPVDYWKLSYRYAPPQVADLYSIGYYRNFKDNTFITSIEGFYKEMNNLVEYKDGAKLFLNAHLETELVPAVGYSYGGEVSIQKNKGQLTGFVNYTYSRSYIATRSVFVNEQVNRGKIYPSIFDKPHNLSISGQWNWASGWSVSSNFIYQTGRPFTFPDGQYAYNESLMFNYSTRYASRLPDFHRMDVSLSYNSKKNKEQKKYSIFNFSIYNVYARKNPYSIFFRQFYGYPKSYRLAVLGTAIPSVTLTKYW